MASPMPSGVTEIMRSGDASHLHATADCRCLFGHDGLPLARTRSGTMTLRDTKKALTFTATVDTRQKLANDLIAIERGDVSQMSVGFVVEDDEWNESSTKRSISRFHDLLDVSAVT
jgi:HK97 family phage prohead protease